MCKKWDLSRDECFGAFGWKHGKWLEIAAKLSLNVSK